MRITAREGRVALGSMLTYQSSSTPKQSSSESELRGDSGNRGATGTAGESLGSGQVDQNVATALEFEATERHPRTGLVRIPSQVISSPFAVNHAVGDLRALIEGTVRREIWILRRAVKALQSQFKVVRWMLRAVITLLVVFLASQVALIILVVNMALSVGRSGTPLPPPRSPAVQVAAETETVPPTGTVLGNEALELAAPGGSPVTADAPRDHATP